VVRDSKATSISVTLEAFGAGGGTEAASGEQKKRTLGTEPGDLTQDARDELQAQSTTQGAVVQDVQTRKSADNAGLQRGDVIVEVNRRATKSRLMRRSIVDCAEGRGRAGAGVVERGQYRTGYCIRRRAEF